MCVIRRGSAAVTWPAKKAAKVEMNERFALMILLV